MEEIEWLRQVCLDYFAALEITCWTDKHGLWFSFNEQDRLLRLAVLPDPFNPSAPPVCCLSIRGTVDIEEAEITETSDTIEGALQDMLEELGQ